MYENQFGGSPLIAMQLLEVRALAFSFTCIEKDRKLFAALKSTLTVRPRSSKLFWPPLNLRAKSAGWKCRELQSGVFTT
jgi:hypothetical protein